MGNPALSDTRHLLRTPGLIAFPLSHPGSKLRFTMVFMRAQKIYMRTFPHPKRKERLTVERNAKDRQRVRTEIFAENPSSLSVSQSLIKETALSCTFSMFSTDPYAETPQETVSSFVRMKSN